MRKLVFEKEARGKLLKGAELMYKAVVSTLGPKGRNVAINYEWRNPIVVHDGVTVAREVMDKDEFVQVGIDLIREASQKTNDEAGDGTTTSTLLAYWIVKHGMTLLDKGVNAMVLRNELNEALPLLQEEIKKIATPIKDNKDVARVAFISSASEEIGSLVAQAVDKVGKDGLVTVEEGKGGDTVVDYTEGMEFDKGYVDYRFVTNPNRMEAIIKDAYVVVLDKKITTGQEIINMLETLVRKTKNIVLIGDINGSALATILTNKMQGNINAVVVHPPSYGDRQKEYLDDIALLTGATVLSDQIGVDIKDFDMSWVGKAETVAVNKNTTMIIEGKGDKKEAEKRVKSLRGLRDKAESTFEKEKIEERLAKLTTGVAVIRVGAKTEVEMREKIERVKDAIGAARAAIDEGIVPGGGVTFLRLRKVLGAKGVLGKTGKDVLYRVLEEPMRKILSNAGEKNVDDMIERILKHKDVNYGYEMNSGKLTDLVKEGIIDPAKVLRLSLENAISVAGSILTTDCLIVTDVEESRKRVVGNQE